MEELLDENEIRKMAQNFVYFFGNGDEEMPWIPTLPSEHPKRSYWDCFWRLYTEELLKHNIKS